ncbi:MAG: hypothetical protein ACK55Z_15495, partial [bacterium]
MPNPAAVVSNVTYDESYSAIPARPITYAIIFSRENDPLMRKVIVRTSPSTLCEVISPLPPGTDIE